MSSVRRLAAALASSPAAALARIGAGLAVLWLAVGLAPGLGTTAIWAQDAPVDGSGSDEATAMAGAAGFHVDGDRRANVGFVQRGDGPRFSLPTIAQVLGLELRVGPLGDSHTLVFEDDKIVFGPDSASFVTVSADGSLRDGLTRLSASPMRTPSGIKVPLDFLEKALGERLGYEFEWRHDEQVLEARRRMLRTLQAEVDVVHQYRVSTVEVRLSERPRWRIERLPDAVELRFVGDRLELLEPVAAGDDPLIRSVDVADDRIRIDLRPSATATEPRLVGDSPVRLVVDVYRSRTPEPELDDEEEGAPIETAARGVRTIVLDPGHGGSETGAIGRSGTIESHQTLRVARMLASSLERRMPVRVVLTREADIDVPHATRVAIANQNKADLFISLHFNSYYGSAARGAETYFLSREASDRVAAAAAERHNSAPVDVSRAGADDLVDLDLILWDLAQSHHLAESQRFANLVQEELNQALGLRDRGVRQAPFRVLMGADMPAVLVELGFLSNPDEEAKLQQADYLNELVGALVRAIRRFKTQTESATASASLPSDRTDAGETE